MSDWLSPMNRLVWIRAFRSKAPQVTIDDGRVFNLDYKRKVGHVLVTPASKGQLIPRGWFELESVTHPLWLESRL